MKFLSVRDPSVPNKKSVYAAYWRRVPMLGLAVTWHTMPYNIRLLGVASQVKRPDQCFLNGSLDLIQKLHHTQSTPKTMSQFINLHRPFYQASACSLLCRWLSSEKQSKVTTTVEWYKMWECSVYPLPRNVKRFSRYRFLSCGLNISNKSMLLHICIKKYKNVLFWLKSELNKPDKF